MHATIPARRDHADRSSLRTRHVLPPSPRSVLGVILALAAAALGGCASAIPPKAEVTGVRRVASTGEGAQIVFEVAASNPNAEPLRLGAVRYEVWDGPTRLFEGERAAATTLPGYATRTILLPAGLAGGTTTPGATLRISGEVEYHPPGVFRRTLEDAGWSSLRTSFAGEGTPVAD